MYEVVIVLSLLFLVDTVTAQTIPEVNLKQGKVIGEYVSTGGYFAFYGVPYAGPTSGANRFKAPTAAPPFIGDFQANNPSIICAQPSDEGIVGTEDCLVLNIFTTNLTTSQPVIVFVDGEDYTYMPDRSQFSYDKLLEHDVIVITINYRLSIFGFLCLGVEDAPGNAGLKDIIAGLQWIKDNIKAFGGDSNNIILFGHGSGAAMVDLVTLSRMSKNLVHKAIACSGASLAHWAVAHDPIGYAQIFASRWDTIGKNASELAKALQEIELDTLGKILNTDRFLNNTALFAPCIENTNLSPTFLSDAPINILRSGSYTHVPFISGYSNKDGTHRLKEALSNDWFDKIQSNFSNSMPVDILNKLDVAKRLKEFYFSTKTVNIKSVKDYLDYERDTMFMYPAFRTVKERSKTSYEPVRIYEMSYKGSKQSDWKFKGVKPEGAAHRSILKYIFDYDLDYFDVYPQKALIGRWVNFAYNGIPRNTSTSQAEWLPVSSESFYYLHIRGDKDLAVHTFGESSSMNPRKETTFFWDGIYEHHYDPPHSVASNNIARRAHIINNNDVHNYCAQQVAAYSTAVLISQIIVRYL